MLVLLDTNVVLRWIDVADPNYSIIRAATRRLIERGDRLCFVPQNVVEFWNVCTRPADRNGLGLTVAETNERAHLMETEFLFLPDDDRVHREWRHLVMEHSVCGAQVHDARLVAAMNVHGIRHLLTLNPRDFRRYGVEVLEPGETLAGQ